MANASELYKYVVALEAKIDKYEQTKGKCETCNYSVPVKYVKGEVMCDKYGCYVKKSHWCADWKRATKKRETETTKPY